MAAGLLTLPACVLCPCSLSQDIPMPLGCGAPTVLAQVMEVGSEPWGPCRSQVC